MIFNKTQKELLLKAYNKKKWTKKFETKILNADISKVNKKLATVRYRLAIKFV